MGLARQCQDREWPQVKACFSLGRVTGGTRSAQPPCAWSRKPLSLAQPGRARSQDVQERLRADAQPGSQDEDREAKRGVRPDGRASSPSPKMVWPGTFMEGAPGPCWTSAPLLVRTGGAWAATILPAFLWDHT